MVPAEALGVEVVYSAREGHMERIEMRLEPGATLADALHASGLLQRYALNPETVSVGIWGKVRALHAALRDRDRVEVYRPLQVDPKEARRQRYRKHRPKADRRQRASDSAAV